MCGYWKECTAWIQWCAISIGFVESLHNPSLFFKSITFINLWIKFVSQRDQEEIFWAIGSKLLQLLFIIPPGFFPPFLDSSYIMSFIPAVLIYIFICTNKGNAFWVSSELYPKLQLRFFCSCNSEHLWPVSPEKHHRFNNLIYFPGSKSLNSSGFTLE